MKKLLSPTDWLLLGIGGFLDFIEEIRDPFGLLENYYSNFLGYSYHRYKRHYFYQCIWRSLKTNNIEKIVIKGKVYFKLTRTGKEKIVDKFPLLSIQNKIWDEKWRLVIYDIEEANKNLRETVRAKLKELGFAQFQKSVWISPHDFLKDLHEFFESKNLLNRVALLETKNFYIKNVKDLAESLWNLDEINKKYEKIYNQLLKSEKELKAGKSRKKESDRRQILDELKFRIIEIYLKDPHLPEELLPDDWWGEKVRDLVEDLEIFEKM